MLKNCRISLASAALLALVAAIPEASAQTKASWQGCAMNFLRNTLDLGEVRMEVPPERIGRNARLMADIIAKDGVAEAALQIHAVYAHCTEPLALQGEPLELAEKLASECGVASVVRFNALGRIKRGEPLDTILETTPEQAREAVTFLHRTAEEASFTKAAFASLESGLSCIDTARRRASNPG